MKTARGDLPVRHLRAGELVVSAEPLLVSTILGSCISVTMFHPFHATGAICHGLLPNGRCADRAPDALRYVDCSVRQMVRRLEALGIPRAELHVKLFGGADVLSAPASAGGRSTIGEQNVRSACLALEAEGLSVLAHDVGGDRGRKLFFLPRTGEVYVKRLRTMPAQTSSCGKGRGRPRARWGAS